MLRLFSYLENSTSTTLLCDAVTKELEGRHNITNPTLFPDKNKHWGGCSACGSWCSENHSFTEHFDDTGSWMQCECGAKNTETFTAHTHSTNWSYNDIAHYHKCDSCEHRVDAELHQYYNDCYPFCLICGYERKVPPHSYSGECDNTCNVCGHVRSIIKEHTYSSECDEECNECSAKRTVEAEHSYTNDCDSDCELCGKTREATHTIYYDWKTDYYYHWQECACGENISERSYHNFDSDGHCTVCGDKDKTSKGLEFNEYATKKYELKSMGTCTDTVVIIPSSYNNIPVNRIATNAFINQYNFTKIILPNTIEDLSNSAFNNCGITELTIPASVNHNNEFAILNCPNLETVTFEEGYRNLSQKHFWKCPKLKTVNLPSTLGRIETKQFNHPNVTIKSMEQWINGIVFQKIQAGRTIFTANICVRLLFVLMAR